MDNISTETDTGTGEDIVLDCELDVLREIADDMKLPGVFARKSDYPYGRTLSVYLFASREVFDAASLPIRKALRDLGAKAFVTRYAPEDLNGYSPVLLERDFVSV